MCLAPWLPCLLGSLGEAGGEARWQVGRQSGRPKSRISRIPADPGPGGRFSLDFKETGFSTPPGGIRVAFSGTPPLTLKLKL